MYKFHWDVALIQLLILSFIVWFCTSCSLVQAGKDTLKMTYDTGKIAAEAEGLGKLTKVQKELLEVQQRLNECKKKSSCSSETKYLLRKSLSELKKGAKKLKNKAKEIAE